MTIFIFLLGTMVGGMVGFFTCALLAAPKMEEPFP